MIEFTIEIPMTVMMCQTPKMILGNYIVNDPRVKQLNKDSNRGYCELDVVAELDLPGETSRYRVTAHYSDRHAEMIARLTL